MNYKKYRVVIFLSIICIQSLTSAMQADAIVVEQTAQPAAKPTVGQRAKSYITKRTAAGAALFVGTAWYLRSRSGSSTSSSTGLSSGIGAAQGGSKSAAAAPATAWPIQYSEATPPNCTVKIQSIG